MNKCTFEWMWAGEEYDPHVCDLEEGHEGDHICSCESIHQ
jgi:hypothetical protein